MTHTGTMRYREAASLDVPAIAASHANDAASNLPDPRIAAYLEGRHHPHDALEPRVAYVAVRDRAVAGYIAGHLTRRYQCSGELQYLYVAPQWRRAGVATELLRLLTGWFAGHGALRVCVDVNDDSPAARPFYTRHGATRLNQHWLVWNDIRDVQRRPCHGGAATYHLSAN